MTPFICWSPKNYKNPNNKHPNFLVRHHPTSPSPNNLKPLSLKMFSFYHSVKTISTDSFSSSSYTSRFRFQPPFDSDDEDDYTPTIRTPTPLSSDIILDFEVGVHVYKSLSLNLPVCSTTLWPRYPLGSEHSPSKCMVSDLHLPETIMYGESIAMIDFEGKHHVHNYYTIYHCTLPYKALRITMLQDQGGSYEHIVFDIPYERVYPFCDFPFNIRYHSVPHIQPTFGIPDSTRYFPKDLFYSSFPTPTPTPTPLLSPTRHVLRKISSVTLEIFKARERSGSIGRDLEEGYGSSRNNLDIGLWSWDFLVNNSLSWILFPLFVISPFPCSYDSVMFLLLFPFVW